MLEIKYIPMKDIKPYKNNPRINDVTVSKLVELYKKYGVRQPITLDDDMNIVVGHSRYEAAKIMGYKKFPCIFTGGLSPELVKSYRLDDNKIGEYSEWDYDLLGGEFDELKELEVDLRELTFTNMELSVLNPVEKEVEVESWDTGYQAKIPLPPSKPEKPKPEVTTPTQAALPSVSPSPMTPPPPQVPNLVNSQPPPQPVPARPKIKNIKLDLNPWESNQFDKYFPALTKHFGTNSIVKVIIESMGVVYHDINGKG